MAKTLISGNSVLLGQVTSFPEMGGGCARRVDGHNQVNYQTIKSHALEMGVPKSWEISDCNLAPMEGYLADKEGQL